MPEKRRERSKIVILSIQETLRRKFNLIFSKQNPCMQVKMSDHLGSFTK